MTYDELKARLDALNAEIDAKRAEAKTIAAELETRLAEKTAAEKLAGMSPAERKAAVQIIGAEAIPSAETVGTPGMK